MDERTAILRKYNFWGSAIRQAGYRRNEYTDKLVEYTGNRLIKVLVGQRRAGKSYILRQIALQLITDGVKPENTLIINREFADFDFLHSYRDLNELIKFYRRELNPAGRVYLFIDEVQNIVGWEHVINSLSQDYTDEYEVFISGSNSNMLSGELATLLSGRYIQVEVFPFSYSEYLGITQQTEGYQSYANYVGSGGLPELFALKTEELKYNYLSALQDTILMRDIIQRHNIRDTQLLQDIFAYLVNNAANLLSVNNIVKYFKGIGRRTSYEIVATYIGYLEDTFVVHRCDRYNIKGKEILSGNAKYYTNDLAYKNYIYPGYGYGMGYLAENLIYLELRRAGFNVYVGSIQHKEVDFVAIKGDRTLYVQSAYLLADLTTVEREYAALEIIGDNYEKYVVSLDPIAFPSKGGIKHIQAWRLNEMLRYPPFPASSSALLLT
ncbi:MAG: ATP-binding protein [Prevotellaceae bacterium]|nr:ATP-binding protein [Prevotellaceae bacterium]